MKTALQTLHAFAPLILVGWGAHMVYPPAGFIAPGILYWIESRFGR